ncbi:MAG: tetratricopeptide repeat protein [Victivallaceae bacterium]
MTKSRLALLLFVFIACRIFADDIGSDFDTVNTTDSVQAVSGETPDNVKSIASFGMALVKKDEPGYITSLLESLRENPSAQLPLQLLLKEFEHKDAITLALPTLFAIAENNPAVLTINVAALIFSAKDYDLSRRIKLAANCVKQFPEPEKLNSQQLKLFCSMVSLLGELYIKQKDFEKGDELFSELMDRTELRETSELVEAATFFYTLAEADSPAERRWLGLLPGRKAQYREMKEELLKTLEESSLKIEGDRELLGRIFFYEQLKMYEEAENLLWQRLLKDPGNVQYKIMLAGLYSRWGKNEQAVTLWQAIIKTHTIQPDYYLALAEAAVRARCYTQAIEAYQWYLLAHPANKPVRFMLGLSYFDNGKYDKAMTSLKQLPDTLQVAKVRAMILANQNKFKEAFGLLKQTEKANLAGREQGELNQAFYLFMMFLAERNGDRKMVEYCVDAMQKLMLLDNPEVANAIGYTFADMNFNLEIAEKFIKKALEVQPDKPEYLDSMAWVLYRQEKFSEAREYIDRAMIKLGSYPHPEIAAHAGDIYYALGLHKEALKYWKAAFKSYSQAVDSEKLEEKIKKLEMSMNSGRKNG